MPTAAEIIERVKARYASELRSAALIVALAVGGFAGCGGSDAKSLTDAGTVALQSGDYARSVRDFDDALARMNPAHDQFLRASFGRCAALAHADPVRGTQEFLKLVEQLGTSITPQDVHFVVSAFVSAREFVRATDIMLKVKALFPKSKEIQAIGDGVASAARRAGDKVTVDRLEGGGYWGAAK